MPVTLEQFAKSLSDSGLLSAEELREFYARLDPKPKDAQGLAKELVRAKKLTKFQVAQVYAGNAKALLFGEYVVEDKIGPCDGSPPGSMDAGDSSRACGNSPCHQSGRDKASRADPPARPDPPSRAGNGTPGRFREGYPGRPFVV